MHAEATRLSKRFQNFQRIIPHAARVGLVATTLFIAPDRPHAAILESIPDFIGPAIYAAGRDEDPKYDVNETISQDPIMLFDGSSEEIERETFTPDDFVDFLPHAEPGTEFSDVLVVPIGFTDDADFQLIDERVQFLTQAFVDLPVTFSYIKRSLPVPVEKIGKSITSASTEADLITRLINKQTGRKYSQVLYAVNSDLFFGHSYASKKRDSSFVSFKHSLTPYILLHEVGHLFGLGDRYRYNIKYDQLRESSEYTFDPLLSIGAARVAYNPDNRAAYVQGTGIVAYGKELKQYNERGFEGFNIMQKVTPKQISSRMAAHEPLFTEFQLSYMKAYLRGRHLVRVDNGSW